MFYQSLRFMSALLLTAALFLSGQCAFAENLTDEQIQVLIQQDRERVLKKYDITVATSGEYPVTIFEEDKVPVPYGGWFSGKFHWVDNDTLIYVQGNKLIPLLHGKGPTGLSIISINLRTLEKKVIADSTSDGLCYDSETGNIRYAMLPEGSEKWVGYYGVLGEQLKETPSEVKDGTYRVNQNDCTLYNPSKELGQPLRKGDGYVKKEINGPVSSESPGKLIFTKEDGTRKVIQFTSAQGVSQVYYNTYLKQYWFGETRSINEGKSKLIYLNKELEVVKEEFESAGSWGPNIVVRNGFISGYNISARTPDGKLLRDKDTRLYNVLGGIFLKTKGHPQRVQIIDGDARAISISPNGCKAVFIYHPDINIMNAGKLAPRKVGLVDLCKSEIEEKVK